MIIYQDGTTTIDVSVQMVTPEMAREWLMMNRGNRALSMKVVRSYADIMDKGCWELNGETISSAYGYCKMRKASTHDGCQGD